MDLFKNFAAAMDRQIEANRLHKLSQARIEQLIQENAELLNSEHGQKQLHPEGPDYLDWDCMPSAYAGVKNGEVGS